MRAAILHLKKADPGMREIIERVGPCVLEYREPLFETLVRSIVFQQLHGKAATTIFNRLAAAVEGELNPESILRLTPEAMRALGLSQQKLSYIRDLAERTQSGLTDFLRCRDLTDDEVIQHLSQVKGIGTWTAQMFLIFALRRPDVLPTGDLAVRAAIKKAYRLRDLPTPARMEKIAASWRPYRSIAAWYLWRSLDTAV